MPINHKKKRTSKREKGSIYRKKKTPHMHTLRKSTQYTDNNLNSQQKHFLELLAIKGNSKQK